MVHHVPLLVWSGADPNTGLMDGLVTHTPNSSYTNLKSLENCRKDSIKNLSLRDLILWRTRFNPLESGIHSFEEPFLKGFNPSKNLPRRDLILTGFVFSQFFSLYYIYVTITVLYVHFHLRTIHCLAVFHWKIINTLGRIFTLQLQYNSDTLFPYTIFLIISHKSILYFHHATVVELTNFLRHLAARAAQICNNKRCGQHRITA